MEEAKKDHELAVCISDDKETASSQAAADAAEIIREKLSSQQEIVLLFSTGTSQLDFISDLIHKEGIEWERVRAFHLDEYLALPEGHAASFVAYLMEHLVDALAEDGKQLLDFHSIQPEDPEQECVRLSQLLEQHPVDLAFVGIGENGHIAFNDPGCNFEALDSFHVVDLDEKCRKQQLGEKWFETLDDVPRQAISMSVPAILRSKKIISVVPEKRKAVAVKRAITSPKISNLVPATALRWHPDVSIYLDKDSSSLLTDQKTPKPAVAPSPMPGPARPAFVCKTFRPGQGWVSLGAPQDRGMMRGQLTPMEVRRKRLADRKKRGGKRKVVGKKAQ